MSRKGTYFEIDRLTNRVRKLEKKVKAFEDFMNNWGPDVQKKRDERDFVPLPKLFKELGTFIKFFGLDTRLRPLTLSRVDVLTATMYYTIK